MKIATWNICLGLKNKKDYVSSVIRDQMIDVCCLQEVELEKDYPNEILSFRDYSIEVEKNNYKARVAIYVKKCITSHRRCDLEGKNSNLVVLDLDLNSKFRLINVYRLFNPPENRTQRDHFSYQLTLIKNALLEDTARQPIIVGDFNLNDALKYQIDYSNHYLFAMLNHEFENQNLVQIVKFPTWSRIVNNLLKSSILDHIYIKDVTLINNVQSFKPMVGDHLLVTFNVNEQHQKPELFLKRNWQKYSKEKLIIELNNVNFECNIFSVQDFWNHFEHKLINIADKLAPLETFTNKSTVKSQVPPSHIKSKLNLRKRLIKRLKADKNPDTQNRIKNLNFEIKNHFVSIKRKNVRRGIIPGNSKTLWDAVNVAKDRNIEDLPQKMYKNNTHIPNSELPDVFANYFDSKVCNILNDVTIDATVYNGKRLVDCIESNFMCENNVIDAILSLKTKNCEGYDRIPQRLITDGIQILIKPLTTLFSKIYNQRMLPEQWLFSKITPVPKKGTKSQIENYRPIANLCSTSKVFEKLILQRILRVETENNCDITGPQQHGFKKGHSTNTAGLALQQIIANALDEDSFAIMANLDLSAAFDLVNVELLLKRMKILGLPDDLIDLVRIWLSTRYFYVSIKGKNSYVYLSRVGTIQGSILGPILYAIFTAPLFDLQTMISFADDANVVRCNKNLSRLINDTQKDLEMITKWLRQSGLKVNDSKTELCLFHRKNQPLVEITVNNVIIHSKLSINVLGVEVDSKLLWNIHISKAIAKAKKAQHAIRLIRKFFNKNELNFLLTANVYSILYYNSDIWHIPTLSPNLKQQLLSASASALKICTPMYNYLTSHLSLHSMNNRATPSKMLLYKHALLLHKTYNDTKMSPEWLGLNFQQNFNNRNEMVNIIDTSKYKIGKNLLVNRLRILNGKIKLDDLNLSLEAFKIKYKELFLR